MAKALNVSVAVTADTSQAKAQLQQLQTTLTQLSSNSANLRIGVNVNDLKDASLAVTELQAHLKAATNINTGTLNFAKLDASIRSSGSNLQKYGEQLLKLGPQGQQAFTQLAQAVAQSEIPVKRLSGIFGEFGTVLKNTIRWQAASSIIHGMMGSIQHAYSYAQDLNASLNNIQIVTQSSSEHMAKFAEQANKAAKQLNTTTTAYTDAALIYYQQGLSDKEVAARTETTIKMANVSGQSAEKVSDQMTAIWNNFAKGSANLEYYADVITALGAATASSSEEISRGLEKFASIADTVGLSYENATAALATITATTRQSADTVGTGLRTLFSRLQSVSLGKTLDDGVTLTKYSKALATIGVSILDQQGELRDMDAILEDMGSKWQTLSDAQKTALAQTVGGVRQYTTLIALMDNFDFYKQNQQIALTSEGTIQAQADIYASSWEASQKRVKAAAEGIYSELIDDSFFISLNNGIAKTLNIIEDLIKGFGGVKGVLASIGTLVSTIFSSEITQGLYRFGQGVKNLFTSQTTLQNRRTEFLQNAANSAMGFSSDDKLSETNQFRRDMFADQLELQNQYANQQRNMTPLARQIAEQQLGQFNTARINYENALQQQRNAIIQSVDRRATVTSEAQRTGKDILSIPYSQITQQQLEQRLNFRHNGWIQQGTNKLSAKYYQDLGQALTDFKKPIEDFTKIDSRFTEFFKTGTEDIKAFREALELDGADQDLLDKITDDLNSEDIQKIWSEFKGDFLAQQDIDIDATAEKFGVNPETLQNYVNALREEGAAAQSTKEYEAQLRQEREKSQKVLDEQKNQMKTAQTLQKIGTGLAGAISMASSSEGLVDTFDAIHNGSIDAADGITQLIGSFSSMATTAGILITQLGWVGAIIAAVGIAWTALKKTGVIDAALDKIDPSRVEKRTKESIKHATEISATVTDTAKERKENFDSDLNAYNELIEKTSQLSVGTLDYAIAIDEANNSLSQLLNTYGDLIDLNKDFTLNKNGTYSLTSSASDRIQLELNKQANEAYSRQLFVQLYQAVRENTVSQDAIDFNDRMIATYQQKVKDEYGLGPGNEDYDKAMSGQYKGPGMTAGEFFDFYGLLSDVGWFIDALDGFNTSIGQWADEQRQQEDYFRGQTLETLSNYVNNGERLREDYVQVNGMTAQQYQGILLNIAAYNDKVGEHNEAITENETAVASMLGEDYYRALQDPNFNFYSDEEKTAIDTYTNPATGNSALISDLSGDSLIAAYRHIIGDFDRDLFLKADGVTLDEEAIRIQLRAANEQNIAAKHYEKIIEEFENIPAIKQLGQLKEGDLETLYTYAEGMVSEDEDSTSRYKTFMANQILQTIDNAVEGIGTIAGDDFANWFANHREDFTLEDLLDTQNILTSFDKLFKNSDLAFKISESLFTPDGLNKGLLQSLSTIDLSSQLNALFDLKKYVDYSSQELSQYYKDFYDIAYEELGGKSGIFSKIFNTENFQKELKDIQKEFKKTGKVSIQSVEKIANSCDELNEALNLNILSIGAVGLALELYSMGAVYDISNISDEVWEVMEAVSGFTDSLSNALKYIDEWDSHLARSTQDLSNHFSKISKDIFQLLGEGNVGGDRLYQQIEGIFGARYASSMRKFFIDQETGKNKDNPQGRQEAYDKRYGERDKYIQQAQTEGNNRALWEGLLSGAFDGAMAGKVTTYRQASTVGSGGVVYDRFLVPELEGRNVSDALKYIGFSLGENNDIELDTYDQALGRGRTTEEMQAAIALAMGIDMDSAGAWLQELAGHSASITQDLKTNDYLMAATKASQIADENDRSMANFALARTTDSYTISEAQKRIDQQRLAAQQVLDNAASTDTEKQNAEDTLKAIEQQQDALNDIAETHDKIIADQETIIANAGQEVSLYDQLSDVSQEKSQNILKNSKTANVKNQDGSTQQEMTNVQQLMDYYESLGMSAEQAWETTKQAYQTYADEAGDSAAAFGITAENAYGNVIGVALNAEASLEDLNEAQKQLAIDMKHSENQELGKDLFKGMVAAASEMQGQLQEITGIDAVINLTIDADTSAAQEKISEVASSAEGTTGTIKIEGNNEEAKTAGDDAATYIDGLSGTVTIDGNTGPFESAMASILNQNYSVNVKVNLTGISSGAIITAATNAARVGYHSKALGGLVQSNAFGSANRSAAPGLSLTAEEGPEVVWNKNDGYAYLVGGNGHPEFVMLRPGDRVFNANQTRKILNYNRPDSNYFNSILNPENMDQKLFGSFSEGSAYGSYGPNSSYGHTGGAGGAGKTKDFTPERYHVIKRQIQDLEFWYDELAKAREKAYGTNILEAIDDEIKATDELLKAQQALVKEAEDFKSKDLAKLQELSKKYNFKLELDSNGNITNWDDLQAEYAEKAANKDETAKEIWDAIKQYEESIDEWQADFSKMTDLQLQKAELQLERITEKREMKIEFDEKEIKLLDFYIKHIENSVYNTAKTIDKTSEKFKFIRDQADAAYESIDSVFEKLVDRSGKEIRKADGSAYTLEDWINMSKEERDALDINYDFGKELEKDYDQILDALEQFDELKTDAIDRFSEAFQELDENIENTIGLFDHYKNMLSTLKDIGDLQGVTLAPEMEKVLEQINQNMFDNIQRTIQASQKEYEFIQQQKDKLQEETDRMIERYGKEDERVIAAQKQLEEYENRMRTLEENMVGSWQEGLNLIQDWFNSTMEKIVSDYESSITGMYKTADEFEKAWDQQKSVEDHYVKDYERYYQISKLQRSITKDLENAAKAGNKQNERMKRLYNDLNKAREDGAEVTAYDLDIFAKRYEYEKALMELEDARNAKNEVRLQRDANGNWGYVYTSVEDEDDLAAKQQRVDDTFYELQKSSQDQLASVSDTMMSRMAGIGARLKELYGEGASPERIKEYLDLVQKELNLDREDIEKALRDAGMTADEAKLRYGADGFDILDNFNETLLSSITGNETLDELMKKLGISISETDTSMQSAVDTYNERIKAINSWFEENGETAAEAIGKLAAGFDQKSKETLETIPGQIQTAKDILDKAFQSMQDYHTKWDTEVGKIENRLNDILTALHQLNAIEIPGPNPVHMDSGGYTGAWGTSGKIAVLHEKENVFDKYDTSNLLVAANILRTLDLQSSILSHGLGEIITPGISQGITTDFEQTVTIHAEFPNAVDHLEIEEAFNNLSNKAIQYANKKNKGIGL